MQSENSQFSLDFAPPILPNLGEICLKFDEATAILISSKDNWPSNIIYFRCFYSIGLENWQGALSLDQGLSEANLFAKIDAAMNNGDYLLVHGRNNAEDYHFKLADLTSRILNLPRFATFLPDLKNVALVFDAYARTIGIRLQLNDIRQIITETNCDFVTIPKLIEYILSQFPLGGNKISIKPKEIADGFNKIREGKGLV